MQDKVLYNGKMVLQKRKKGGVCVGVRIKRCEQVRSVLAPHLRHRLSLLRILPP